MPAPSTDGAIGRLEGKVEVMAADLAHGRQRINETAASLNRIEAKLEDFVQIKDALMRMAHLPSTAESHSKRLEELDKRVDSHDEFRNRVKGSALTLGGLGGLITAAFTIAANYILKK